MIIRKIFDKNLNTTFLDLSGEFLIRMDVEAFIKKNPVKIENNFTIIMEDGETVFEISSDGFAYFYFVITGRSISLSISHKTSIKDIELFVATINTIYL